MKPIIYTRLAGGLGNQLFQVNAADYIGNRLYNEFKIIALVDSLARYTPPRRLMIDTIADEGILYMQEEDTDIKIRLLNKLRLARLGIRSKGIQCINDRNANIERKWTDKKRNIYLDGYFQDKSYISGTFLSLCRKNMKVDLVDELKRICWTESVAIHIRRTDYGDRSNSRIYQELDSSYYRSALEKIGDMKHFLFFSDDWRHAEIYADKYGGINISRIGLGAINEFKIMTKCKNFIVANSTFSWWAAMIGRKEDSMIISPREWYKDRRYKNRLNGDDFILV